MFNKLDYGMAKEAKNYQCTCNLTIFGDANYMNLFFFSPFVLDSYQLSAALNIFTFKTIL